MRKVAIIALDTKKDSEYAISKLLKIYLKKGYGGIIYTPKKLEIITPGFLQKRISFPRLKKSWIIRELALDKYEILFFTHVSELNLPKKLRLAYYRRRKIRLVNYEGDYYSPKDIKNVITQNYAILTVRHANYTHNKLFKLAGRSIDVVVISIGIIVILPSLMELFYFLRRSKVSL